MSRLFQLPLYHRGRMLGKVRRIFFRTLAVLAAVVILAAMGLYFGVQSYTFQTWLGQHAGNFLSSELNSKVSIDKIRVDFFSRAQLTGVLLVDKHKDTIFYGDINASIHNFNFNEKKFLLKNITISNATSKIIKYHGDSLFNYAFIADYFAGSESDTSTTPGWDVAIGDVELKNINFSYRNENYNTQVTPGEINYNNIVLHQTHGKITKPLLTGDTLYATLKELRASEQSGFNLLALNTTLQLSEQKLLCENLYLKAGNSLVKGHINFLHKSWNDYDDFVNKVAIRAELKDSTSLDFNDISFFTSELKGLHKTVKLSGKIKGYVTDFSLSDFEFWYGKHTRFNGNLSINGLPNIKSSYIHLDARRLSTSYADMVSIPSYPFDKGEKIKLPVEIQRLGIISYRGKFDGLLTDFKTYGTFSTDLGMVSTQLSIKMGNKPEDITYSGKIKTGDFNLGTFLGQKNFDALSLNCEVKGQGVNINSIKAILEGQINKVRFNGYTYSNINLNGKIDQKIFSGLLLSKDPNANFDFNGTIDFNGEVPEMDFISTINNLRLKELNFASIMDSGSLSSQIFIKIKGHNIDNLSGQINFDNTNYKTKSQTYGLSTMNLLLEQDTENKKIKLNSAYFNAEAAGAFKLSNIVPVTENLFFYYYPDYFKKPTSTKKYSDQINFKLKIKKFDVIKNLFLPDIAISPGSLAEGSLNASENKLDLKFVSQKVSYKRFGVNELNFVLGQNNSTVQAEISGKSLTVGDSLKLVNFKTGVQSLNKNADFTIGWNNQAQPATSGEIKGSISFENNLLSLVNEKILVTVNDCTWTMKSPTTVSIDNNNQVHVAPFVISNNAQSINIAGTLSNKPGDSLAISVTNVAVAAFNPLLRLVGLKLEGFLNGHLSLSNEENNFTFGGNLALSAFKLNNNLIGELTLDAFYAPHENLIKLNGYTSLGLQDEYGNQVKNIAFNGAYYLRRAEESLDINFSANPANLKLLNPLLEDILTIENGFVTGQGRIHGTPANLMLEGKLRLFNSAVKVDYTNVTYNITGNIEIMPDQIRFSDMLMREKGAKTAPQGTLNGNVFHHNFNHIQLDYDINYNNMLVLNTTGKENKTFYGKVYGTGNVGIYGFLNNLHMTIKDTTTRNSRFYLPLDGPAEVSENDLVHFVKRDTVRVKEKSLSGFNLDLSIHATPGASVQIIFDKQTGDVLNAQGKGDLNMRVNTLGKFEMFGDYIITAGDYMFSLENVINKKFEIEPGSSISWSGDPINADIDVVTSYKQRASIAPLLNDTNSQYKGRFPVVCKLLITDKLFSPQINFAIDFPGLNATDKTRIDNILSDEAELNRQMASFLFFRTFVTPLIFNANGGGVTAGNAAASTSSELLSNRVSELLNAYFGNLTGLRDVQLGLNYRPGSQSNNEVVDLALSKQFLNDKISLDGNFGISNNQTKSSGGLIGDVNISYKLSDDGRYRLKGFNRTNDNTQLATMGGAFTQGVGFFYREEFETFNELLKHYQTRLKQKKTKP